MLHKTKAIVLNYLKYSETSIIVNIYTDAFGTQTYIENGVRKAKARNKIALFQPLTLLDMVVYKKENSGLNRLSEIKCTKPYRHIPYEIIKSTIGIFLAEVLSIILKAEEEANPSLFEYLENELLFFDQQEANYQNFHLKILLNLSRFLGFYPADVEEMLEELRPFQRQRITHTEINKFNDIISGNQLSDIKLSSDERNIFLKLILDFYRLQSDTLKEVKSLKILHEVLR